MWGNSSPVRQTRTWSRRIVTSVGTEPTVHEQTMFSKGGAAEIDFETLESQPRKGTVVPRSALIHLCRGDSQTKTRSEIVTKLADSNVEN